MPRPSAASRIVNSAYYGLPQRLNNLRFAVAYLGLNEIQQEVDVFLKELL
jgi:hypothetical protein